MIGGDMPDEQPDYSLLDSGGLSQMIFYPRADVSRAPAHAEDFSFEITPGVTLGARLYISDPANPTILYFHGNGEVAGDHNDIAPFYYHEETNLCVVEFRGYGNSTGAPSFAALVGDGVSSSEWFHRLLDERGFCGHRFVMGRSLGSQPALEVAARTPGRFRGLIIESGAGSIRGMLSRAGLDPAEDAAVRLVAAHDEKIRSIKLPALIIHGEQDELVPLARADELRELLGSPEKELLVIHGAGHNDILWRGAAEYFGSLGAFVRRNSR
jgi:pimeloyl-ACP methyl ester carboxylesterase